uniref:Uncharacterized protein n=1 Tax=Anguilla anguilla TaxID=7936 RepID=A0A0E9UPQ3_ANGAN
MEDSPSAWILRWLFKLDVLEKHFSHCVHLYGFSPV